jgi:hypothetical protein
MTDLEQKVLDTIRQRNLAPRPYYLFLARRSVFFSLAAISILLGAVSAAVLFFAVADYYATNWRLLDNLPLDDLILSIPVLWLILMPVFVASAFFSLRQTPRGYRFRAGTIIVWCLAASLGLGAVLHFLDVGQRISGYLIAHVDWYRLQADVPFAVWSRPELGYLGGKADVLLSDAELRLIDFNLNVWIVDMSGASIGLDQPILSEGDLAIRGHVTGPLHFRADVISSFD